MDLAFVEPELFERYPNVFAILRVTKPKTRRIHSAATVQHVVVQDRALATFLRRTWDDIPPARMSELIWTQTAAVHGYRFKQAVQHVAPKVGWTLAGLRGGGATDFYLRTMDVTSLRRRGRWAQLATVDRYVQEAAACLHDDLLPPGRRQIMNTLAKLCVEFTLHDKIPTPLCNSTL